MIDVYVGDLIESRTQAVVRPVCADWSAVTPAMRRLELAAGSQLAEQCSRLGELPPGSAAITGAGKLPAEFMVHAVVRSSDEPTTAAVVRNAMVNALRRLTEWEIDKVAMPLLGTGAGNLQVEESAEIMVSAILEHRRSAEWPAGVDVVVESEYERDVFQQVLRWHRPSDAESPP